MYTNRVKFRKINLLIIVFLTILSVGSFVVLFRDEGHFLNGVYAAEQNPCGNGVIDSGEECERDSHCGTDYYCSNCNCYPEPSGDPSNPPKPPVDYCDIYTPRDYVTSRCVGPDLYYYNCSSEGSNCDFRTAKCDYTFCCTHFSTYSNHPSCVEGPYPNPPLPLNACGLNIVLVLDDSESIDNYELDQMKNAFKGFIDQLKGTPTIYSVIRFDTRASIIQRFTSDTSLVKSAIDSISSDGNTNWDEPLELTRNELDSSDGLISERGEYFNFVLFASDGNANTYGKGDWSESRAVSYAETEADWIKYSGARMFGIAIGDEINIENLKAITGPNVDKPNMLESDLVTADFDTLASQLGTFARSACQGTISINKYLETVSESTKGGSGWGFKIAGPDNRNLTTNLDGSVNSGFLSEGTYSVVETDMASSQYNFSSVICKDQNDKVLGSKISNGVGEIEIRDEDIVSCNFINSEIPPNILPNVLGIEVEEEGGNILGFTSDTHTGLELNNNDDYKTKVVAQYQDEDGEKDIQAVYVWWSTSGNSIVTPDRLGGASPKTQNNGNFGIMIRRNPSSSQHEWKDVYIPAMGAIRGWYRVGTISDGILIKGKDGKDLVQISDILISDDDTANKVNLSFRMQFTTPEGSGEVVDTDNYHIWGLVSDTATFIEPGDPSSTIIKNNDDWSKETTWNLDMKKPQAEKIEIIYMDNNMVKVTVKGNDAGDGMKVSKARLDACITDGSINPPLKVGTSEYTLKDCNDLDLSKINMTAENSLLFAAGDIADNKSSFEITKQIDFGTHDEGSVSLYLTVMDYAGNYNYQGSPTPPPVIIRFEDWAVVQHGLTYGGTGTNSFAREINDESIWDGSPIDSFNEKKSDLTNHALLGGDSTTTNNLRDLIHYRSNNSFKAAKFSSMHTSSTVTDLVTAYKVKSNNLKFYEKDLGTAATTTIDGKLSDYCDIGSYDYCTLMKNQGDLIINKFKCNHMGLIIVNGDVTIKPDFNNDSNSDACIILATGNVTIEKGSDKGGNPGYDRLEAFVITGKRVIISKDTNGNDGLFVEGGLVALSESVGGGVAAIENSRDIPFSKRHVYPVIAVDCKSKYGLLARAMFGSPIDIFKSEVGFKPY